MLLDLVELAACDETLEISARFVTFFPRAVPQNQSLRDLQKYCKSRSKPQSLAGARLANEVECTCALRGQRTVTVGATRWQARCRHAAISPVVCSDSRATGATAAVATAGERWD